MSHRIYTKNGDQGMTRIHGGERIPKDDVRIEANGSLDELNAVIGVIRSFLPEDHEWQDVLYRIQKELMGVMSQVATPLCLREKNPNQLPADLVSFCEQQIDRMTRALEEKAYFVLPGGNVVSAHCQWARTVARRAERRLWTLNRQEELPAELLIFVNRLSDLFFVMARLEMQQTGCPEEKWKSFAYQCRPEKEK